ncbi:hypothetical protein RvY_08291 [Ramazzottius varieornatus]|uniref:Uncharacterized protein n=1 Tax=Ramazzottius varieornatus TaxID=947166 RepID=A0A1D1V5C4_RAMVA|nr:hypothetical protein RvY_08291 [Ramazzottius varieornatus]
MPVSGLTYFNDLTNCSVNSWPFSAALNTTPPNQQVKYKCRFGQSKSGKVERALILDSRYEPAPAPDVASYFASRRDDAPFSSYLAKRSSKSRTYQNLSKNKQAIVQLYFLTDWWRFEQARAEVNALAKTDEVLLPHDIAAELERKKNQTAWRADKGKQSETAKAGPSNQPAKRSAESPGEVLKKTKRDGTKSDAVVISHRPDEEARGVELPADLVEAERVTDKDAVAPKVRDRGWGGQVYLAFYRETSQMRLFWTLPKVTEMLVQVTPTGTEYYHLGLSSKPGRGTLTLSGSTTTAIPPQGAQYQRFVAQTSVPVRVNGLEALKKRAKGQDRNKQSVGNAGSTNHTQSWPRAKSMSSYVRQEIWNRARMLLSIQPLGSCTPLTAEQQASLATLKVRAKRNRKNKGQVGRPANTGNRYTDAAAADFERFTTETRAYTAALAAQTSPTKAKSPAKKPAQKASPEEASGDDAPGPRQRAAGKKVAALKAKATVAEEDDDEDEQAAHDDKDTDGDYKASGESDESDDTESEDGHEE